MWECCCVKFNKISYTDEHFSKIHEGSNDLLFMSLLTCSLQVILMIVQWSRDCLREQLNLSICLTSAGRPGLSHNSIDLIVCL